MICYIGYSIIYYILRNMENEILYHLYYILIMVSYILYYAYHILFMLYNTYIYIYIYLHIYISVVSTCHIYIYDILNIYTMNTDRGRSTVKPWLTTIFKLQARLPDRQQKTALSSRLAQLKTSSAARQLASLDSRASRGIVFWLYDAYPLHNFV